MRSLIKLLLAATALALVGRLAFSFYKRSAPFELQDGERVVFLGDTLIERAQYHGWIELMLTTRFADRNITFRNLGWSADTPDGDSRLGLSLLQAGHEPAGESWQQLVKQLEAAKPNVVFLGYGMASSFAGEAGLKNFKKNYTRLLDVIQRVSPTVRFVLLGPVPHESLGPPWADPAKHNEQLQLYTQAIREIAQSRHAASPSLFYQTTKKPALAVFIPLTNLHASAPTAKLTDNGIHLNDHGYRALAELIEQQLFAGPGAWRTSPQTENLRQAILRKDEWYFHRSRPGNMAYIFGFRKKEQGANAVEIPQFDANISAEEARIEKLRTLQPAEVPPIPRRNGNLITQRVEQAHPQFEVADGLEVTLWAENPLLDKPIHMNFDPRGRLWVACSPVYPQIEPGQAPTDKIVILEDTTGQGRADKVMLFAQDLLIPTGLEPGNGGVYVAQSTDLLFLKDTDGDGKADERRVVLSGFGTEDSHQNLHTLHWGPDGRLYMNQSVYTRTNTETPSGLVRLNAGGVYRFDPRDQKMEIVYRGWVNSWGHQFDHYGQSFFTDGAGSFGISWGVPGATYFTLGPARRVLQSVSVGSYPKFCGLEIVHSAQFPSDWQGDLITNDFRANRVVRFKISDQGAGYVTQQMPDILRTTADSFRPIDVKLGPDGALYIADWSNPIIQHGEVDFRDPRRDKVHGRIWRVTAKGRAPLPITDFTQLTVPALLDQLLSPNNYHLASARRVLIERGAESVLPELARWTLTHATEPALLQALWLYQSFNQPPQNILTTLLSAHDPGIRAAAVRALPPAMPNALAQLTQLVADQNPRVRLEAVRALGKIPSVAAMDQALTVLNYPMDVFIDHALWLTVNQLADPWLAAVKSGNWKITGREHYLSFALKAIEPARAAEVLGPLLARQPISADGAGPWIELIGSAGERAELQQLLVQINAGGFTDAATIQALAALNQAARLRKKIPAGELTLAPALLQSDHELIRINAAQLIGIWKLPAFNPALLEIAGRATTSPAERTGALTALREIGGEQVTTGLKYLIGQASSPAIRREAVVTLALLNLPAALPEILAVLQKATAPAEAQLLWRGLLGINGADNLLAQELPKTALSVEAAREGLRFAREGNQHPALVQTLTQIAGLTVSTVSLTPAELQNLATTALALGDAVRGEQIYRRADLACSACHAIGGVGGKIGPDLTSIGASAPTDYLWESLLYPNSKIKEGYHAVAITTQNQQIVSGIIIKESDRELVIRNIANQEISIPAQDITSRVAVGSLMPAGLLDSLLPDERLDLIKFLTQLGKPGNYDAAKRDVARFWRLYQATWKNSHLGVDRVAKGDFTLPDWVPTNSLVNGTLPSEVLATVYLKHEQARGLFAATRFQALKKSPTTFTLVGAVESIWLNGQTIKPGAQFTIETNVGVNTLVFRFPASVYPAAIKLSSPDVIFLAD